MDESALKILLSNLDNCRSSLDSWLSFFTALVTIGVVLEVVFVVWEYLDDLRTWRRGFVFFVERPNTVLLVCGLFGATMVAVGVAGEWRIDAKIGVVETEIRKANDDRAILLSQEAGDAKKSAEDAEKALGQTQREAKAFEKELQTALINLHILQGAVSARHVIDAKPLEKLKLKNRQVMLDSFEGDEEAKNFCASIAAALHDSAGAAPLVACGAIEGGIESGVFEPAGAFVLAPNLSDAETLASALSAATHVKFLAEQNRPTQSGLRIEIGQRTPAVIAK